MHESSTAFLVQFERADSVAPLSPCDVLTRLAHEMAEPLGAIEAISYYLRMVIPTADPRVQQQLERIGELVDAANGALGDALQYLREGRSEREVIDLHALLREAVAEQTRDLPASLQLTIGDGSALVRMEPGQGRQLLRSLLGFYKYMAARCEGAIVRTIAKDAMVTLEFTALGLSPTRAEVEAMFEPFGNGFAEGTGLALASARRIFESNGGRVTAHSDNGRDLSLVGAIPLAY